MDAESELEELRSVLSCVFEKLGAESLTEPDRVELVARAEVVQEQIDAIEDVTPAWSGEPQHGHP
ncbi:hypothetical protein [Nocardia sp. CDC160]|uniref:hypothetical protein n=1 Tax=Nocardia sp. CDC160 TaxID=3112166 RepID=UPI002DB7BDEE|nr:hypothetical protein [Nocardia sp. CDC160]MEC3918527.1 hypothetical protein [Nocardia sp. CDC160]